jgi:transcriptional regulator with XRE-family HTH domain
MLPPRNRSVVDPEELRAEWGVNIRLAREAAKLTQAKLGASCGVNQSTVAKWEKGSISPTRQNMVRLADVLGIEARNLFPLDVAV